LALSDEQLVVDPAVGREEMIGIGIVGRNGDILGTGNAIEILVAPGVMFDNRHESVTVEWPHGFPMVRQGGKRILPKRPLATSLALGAWAPTALGLSSGTQSDRHASTDARGYRASVQLSENASALVLKGRPSRSVGHDLPLASTPLRESRVPSAGI